MAAHHILDISCYDGIIYTIKYNLLRSKGTSQKPFYPSVKGVPPGPPPPGGVNPCLAKAKNIRFGGSRVP